MKKMINLATTSVSDIKSILSDKGLYTKDIELALLDLAVYGANEMYINKLNNLCSEKFYYEKTGNSN